MLDSNLILKYAERNTSPKVPIEKKMVHAFICSLFNNREMKNSYQALKDVAANGKSFNYLLNYSKDCAYFNNDELRDKVKSIIAYSLKKKDLTLFKLLSEAFFTGEVKEVYGNLLSDEVFEYTDEEYFNSQYVETQETVYTEYLSGDVQEDYTSSKNYWSHELEKRFNNESEADNFFNSLKSDYLVEGTTDHYLPKSPFQLEYEGNDIYGHISVGYNGTIVFIQTEKRGMSFIRTIDECNCVYVRKVQTGGSSFIVIVGFNNSQQYNLSDTEKHGSVSLGETVIVRKPIMDSIKTDMSLTTDMKSGIISISMNNYYSLEESPEYQSYDDFKENYKVFESLIGIVKPARIQLFLQNICICGFDYDSNDQPVSTNLTSGSISPYRHISTLRSLTQEYIENTLYTEHECSFSVHKFRRTVIKTSNKNLLRYEFTFESDDVKTLNDGTEVLDTEKLGAITLVTNLGMLNNCKFTPEVIHRQPNSNIYTYRFDLYVPLGR